MIHAPMVVNYQGTEYVAEGFVARSFPEHFTVKTEEQSHSIKMASPQEALHSFFVCRKWNQGGTVGEGFRLLPIEHCYFIRYLKTCAVCEAPQNS